MMTMIGARVSHVQFGGGIIISQDQSYLCIRFDGTEEEKTFLYPEAFSLFLKMEDENYEAAIREALLQKHLQEQEKQAIREEKLRKMQAQLMEEKSTARARPKGGTAKKRAAAT